MQIQKIYQGFTFRFDCNAISAEIFTKYSNINFIQHKTCLLIKEKHNARCSDAKELNQKVIDRGQGNIVKEGEIQNTPYMLSYGDSM